MQNTGRQQSQHRFFAVDDQRMSRVVAALKSNHSGYAIRQQIDNFALALVAPLRADDDYVFAHDKKVKESLRVNKLQQPEPY
jgi:hypothetical protein